MFCRWDGKNMSADRAPATPGVGSDGDLGGVASLLSRTVEAIRSTPELIVLFVFVAAVSSVPIIGGLVVTIGQGIGIVLVSARLEETASNADNSLGVRLIVLFVSSLVAGVVIILGFLFLILPGFYLVARLYLGPPAVMLDDCGPVEALGESWSRTDGNALTVFGVALAVGALGIGAGVAVLLAQSGGVDPALARITSGETVAAETVASFVGGTLTAAASTVIYHRTGR
jgi:hypothetical protein